VVAQIEEDPDALDPFKTKQQPQLNGDVEKSYSPTSNSHSRPKIHKEQKEELNP
jgi:hypothetical protein